MNGEIKSIRNISDTAIWAAYFRARESQRKDALFHDPLAEILIGDRGEEIIQNLPGGDKNSWAWSVRTYLFDQVIAQQVSKGVDMVINLAAGLDCRPYRMELPISLKWIEIDLPEIFEYKDKMLQNAQPKIQVERIRLDLSDEELRRKIISGLDEKCEKALVISEGLLIYLTHEAVTRLASELAGHKNIHFWVIDLQSPGLLKMMLKDWGKDLEAADALPQFAPPEGPGFFRQTGWRPLCAQSIFKTACKFKRVPFPLNLMRILPESSEKQGRSPWSAVCLFEKL